MLANLLVKPGRVELREISAPEPSYGEILVKIKTALTCGTDLKAFLRGHPLIPMPGVFGHEFSGVVEKAGKGVRRFKEGDAVMAVHTAPCLKCSFCKTKHYSLCESIMSTKVLGAFAEYVLLPSHVVKQNLFRKPENISFEEAAFLEPLSCVVHSVEPLRIKKGESALILGAGPIGLLHLLLLKRKGARVAVSDILGERLRTARKLGADLVMRTKRLSAIGKASPRIPFPRGFNYVFECTGKPDVWETSVDYVRRGGTVILFGGCESGTTVSYNAGRLHYDEVTLRGVFHYTPSEVKKAYQLLCKGELGVSRLISGRYSLADTQQVFEKLAKGIGIKFAIIPEGFKGSSVQFTA